MSIFALVDGNNFFVSCHRAKQQNLNGIPVVVISHDGGIIIARSDEAKKLGIKMAEPVFKVQKIIDSNNVTCIYTNAQLYKDISRNMMEVFHRHSPKVQKYSIDEAFLDFTGVNPDTLNSLGHDLKNDVMKTLNIPVSVGFAQTKTLAKLSNSFAKTYKDLNGVHSFYDQERLKPSLGLIPIGDVWGIGSANAKILKGYGINTALDLATMPIHLMKKRLNLMGQRTYHELNGRICYPLKIEMDDQKSIMESRTLIQATASKEMLREELSKHIVNICVKIREMQLVSNEVSVFISTNKFGKGPQYEKSAKKKIGYKTNITTPLLKEVHLMLDEIFKESFSIKKQA
jgi:DNA polymerase V